MACLPIHTVARRLLLATGLVLGLVLLSGCDTESYSEDLRYPARTDPIVSGSFEATPDFPDVPGRLPLMSIRDLADTKHPLNNEPGIQNKIFDPSKVNAEQRHKLQQLLEEKFGTQAHP